MNKPADNAPVENDVSGTKPTTAPITGSVRAGTSQDPAVKITRSPGRAQPNNTPKPRSLDGAELHGRLHALSTKSGDELAIRQEFREIIMDSAKCVGVGHAVLDESGNWIIKPEYSSGRLPQREDFVEKFAQCCKATIQRNSIQTESFLGLESIYTPIRIEGSDPEVLIVLTQQKNATHTLFLLEIVTAYFGLWLKEARSERSGWKLNSLAALIELVSQIESQQSANGACQVAASELARYLNASQVAIGFIRKDNIRVEALSGSSSSKQDSETLRAYETAMNECLLRDDLAAWPDANDETLPLMLGHQQLAKDLQCTAVMSSPLTTVDGKKTGVLVCTGSKELIHGDRLPNFVRAAAPRVAGAIDVVHRSEKSGWQRFTSYLKNQASTIKGRVWYSVAALMLAILVVPVPYRVRCNCATETTQKRMAVAPFDGLIKRGYVEPGDLVKEGQLLAMMDGQSIRFELAGITAELNQASRKSEIELSGRNIPASLLANLESKRLTARKNQLEFQQDQIEIRSPFDGIVLSGSLERTEGASVKTGKVLFEVAPLKSLKVEVSIPSEEIAHTKVGQSTRIWIEGLESQSFNGTISRIHPRSELRDGRNVFVAEVTVDNPDERLRPGMQGHARIDCRSRPLAWNLFHKPWNFVASRLTWW